MSIKNLYYIREKDGLILNDAGGGDFLPSSRPAVEGRDVAVFMIGLFGFFAVRHPVYCDQFQSGPPLP